MPIDDFTSVPITPEGLNAFYHKAALVTDLVASPEVTNEDIIWNKMYNGSVVSYDPAGKGYARRNIMTEFRRANPRFSSDWSMWKRGCGPNQFTPQEVGRPGTSDYYSYMTHLEKQSHFYNLKSILAESMYLPQQLQQDMDYLERFRRDTYAETWRNYHHVFAYRHWMGWKDSGSKYHFDEKLGGGEWTQPWKFGVSEDGCLPNTDFIYVNPDTVDDVEDIQAFTPKCARRLQQKHARSSTLNGTFSKVNLITSDTTPSEIFEQDDTVIEAIKRRSLGADVDGTLLWNSLSLKRSIGDLMTFTVDPRILRYTPTGETNDDGWYELARVDDVIQRKTGSGDHDLFTEDNPDWENPNVAAFELYVVDNGPIFTPMRPSWPTSLGHNMSFGAGEMPGKWQWYNVQDMALNRRREWGFFELQDDIMAVKQPSYRNASVVLVRRRPDDWNMEDITADIVSAEFENETSERDCTTVQPVCVPPGSCPPSLPGSDYGYDEVSPSCPSCF